MGSQEALPEFHRSEQMRLDGIPATWIQPPLMNPVHDREQDVPQPGLDQLSFGPNQQVLTPQPPEPQQLAMLPEPAPWEMSDEPVRPITGKGRLAKRRSRAGISPGQTTLF